MGNEILAGKTGDVLLSFNADYLVPDEVQCRDLMDDFSCFMSSAMEVLKEQIGHVDNQEAAARYPGLALRLWGAYHLFQMAQGAAEAAGSRRENNHG